MLVSFAVFFRLFLIRFLRRLFSPDISARHRISDRDNSSFRTFNNIFSIGTTAFLPPSVRLLLSLFSSVSVVAKGVPAFISTKYHRPSHRPPSPPSGPPFWNIRNSLRKLTWLSLPLPERIWIFARSKHMTHPIPLLMISLGNSIYLLKLMVLNRLQDFCT